MSAREQLQQAVRNGEAISNRSIGAMALEGCDLSGGIFDKVTFEGTRLAQARLAERSSPTAGSPASTCAARICRKVPSSTER